MHPTVRSIARRIIPGWMRTWRADRFRARVQRVTPRVLTHANGRILTGPFAGMPYITEAHCSQLGPKLLGTYELEIADIIRNVGTLRPDLIVDAGAAEGYYAIGLMRLAPEARVVAFEAEADARRSLGELADLNAVRDRVDLRGRCEAADLEVALAGAARPFILMDIEGGERFVLDPGLAPRLRSAWILVELHPDTFDGLQDLLATRFASSHRVTYVAARDRGARDLPELAGFSRGDLAAAAWEGRDSQQGWLWMEPRVNSAP